MKRHRFLWIVFRCLVGFALATSTLVTNVRAEAPTELLLLDRAKLAEAKQRIEAGEKRLVEALQLLRAEAEGSLEAGPFSVTEKEFVPPSGDKRDYMSQGPYWWPNPDTDDGLPYVRRDGEVNPERDKYDSRPKGEMVRAVRTLATAWYFTGHEPYAEHAALLLRTWFLDEETGMNPHLRYAQAIPGRNKGRSIGIIDTVGFISLIDPILLLADSPAWSKEDQQKLREWFREYLRWLRESDFGQRESKHPNNHGTWYDAQVVAFALFVGEDETAREVLQEVGQRRIARHIEPDGSQPRELSRTRAFDYSVYNLKALVWLAELGEQVDVDLWNFRTDDGRSIRAALDWLAPYVTEEEEFEYRQIRSPNRARTSELYRRAAEALDVPRYHRIAEAASEGQVNGQVDLLLPPPQRQDER